MSGPYYATCTDCGVRVLMGRIKGTSLARAMEPHRPTEPYWTVDTYGYIAPGGGFIEHICDVAVVAQFRSTWLGRANLQNELNTAAYARECPKCGAAAGEECENLIERHKHGKTVHTKAPHQERYPEEEKPA